MKLIFNFAKEWQSSTITAVRNIDGYNTITNIELQKMPEDILAIVMDKIGMITQAEAPWRATQAWANLKEQTITVKDATYDEESGEQLTPPETELKQWVEIDMEVRSDATGGMRTITAEQSGLKLEDADTLKFWKYCEELPITPPTNEVEPPQ